MLKSSTVLEYLLYFISIVLLHDYYLYKTAVTVLIFNKKPSFTLLDPYQEVKKHRYNINVNQLVDINFKFTINPKICTNEPFLLIIVVSSGLNNFVKRKAVRETWGQGNNAIKIVFTVGNDNNQKLTKEIVAESNKYGDIVQGDFKDVYRNLTYKHVMGLKWVHHHCSSARYLLKTDDDVFVNYGQLMQFLVRQLSPWGAQNLIACIVWTGMEVLRKNDTKWYVSKEEYEPNEYPPYCSGSFILYSQDVLPFLVEGSQTTKYLFVDDAFVTDPIGRPKRYRFCDIPRHYRVAMASLSAKGIVATKMNIPRTDISYLYLNHEKANQLLQGNLTSTPFLFGPMNVDPDGVRKLWRKMPESHYNQSIIL